MKKEILISKILLSLLKKINSLELLIIKIILINFNIDNNRILNLINNRFTINNLISFIINYFHVNLIIQIFTLIYNTINS